MGREVNIDRLAAEFEQLGRAVTKDCDDAGKRADSPERIIGETFLQCAERIRALSPDHASECRECNGTGLGEHRARDRVRFGSVKCPTCGGSGK